MSEQAKVGTESVARAAGAGTQTLDLHRRFRLGEAIIQGLLFFCGFVSIFTTLGIVYVLFTESINFFVWTEVPSEITGGRPLSMMSEGDLTTMLEENLSERQISSLESQFGEIDSLSESELATAASQYLGERPVSIVEFFSPVRMEDGELQLAKWQPQIGQFSIWPLANSTFIITFIALLVAIPLGLGAAIYLSEYATQRVRGILKPVLEILAGIPTVVYGFFAITFMTPLLRSIFGSDVVQIYNMASAGIVVGILILPMIASMSEDALSSVPSSLRQASYGLGATRFETATRVVLPGALSGVIAALIVATSRAVGETMIVAIAAGAGPNFTFNPFEAAETMTGHIARISSGDISYETIDYNSLFAIGLTLFVITLTLNIISQRVIKRFREVYE
jgi:phosphate transport system permease protein